MEIEPESAVPGVRLLDLVQRPDLGVRVPALAIEHTFGPAPDVAERRRNFVADGTRRACRELVCMRADNHDFAAGDAFLDGVGPEEHLVSKRRRRVFGQVKRQDVQRPLRQKDVLRREEAQPRTRRTGG